MTWKYAICNETFQDWPHEKVCQTVREIGYTGLEIAPFTIAPYITEVSTSQRQELRRVAEANDLKIIGLHWLLAKTEGFMLTSPDPAIRQRTALYLGELARACADLGGDILVLGSPMQRKIPPGADIPSTTSYALDTLQQVLPFLDETKVDLCIEPLAPTEADFLQTAAEGKAMMDQLNHPHVRLHLDVKAMSSEAVPIPQILEKFHQEMRHFHANDANMRGPGFGDTDFLPIFQALKNIHYSGWVSVEVFNYLPDPVTIAQKSLEYMHQVAGKLQ
ncbi:MAG: sugar phosphate isomerase/epimerase family protein [Zavarzinella sp.]